MYISTGWVSLISATGKILKCWPITKPYFQRLGQEECFPIQKYFKDEK